MGTRGQWVDFLLVVVSLLVAKMKPKSVYQKGWAPHSWLDLARPWLELKLRGGTTSKPPRSTRPPAPTWPHGAAQACVKAAEGAW
jgi:hypothetical protein